MPSPGFSDRTPWSGENHRTRRGRKPGNLADPQGVEYHHDVKYFLHDGPGGGLDVS